MLVLVPLGLLFVASLPPARSSFVERYLLVSFISAAWLFGVTLVYGLTKVRLRWRIVAGLAIVAVFAIGISNVYYYGNFNKNSSDNIRTKQLVQAIDARSKPGEPIIANSPWIFYEAIFYSTNDHPVYFIDADTQYIYGSLDMLKKNDMHKIKDVPAFLAEHPTVWYIGVTGAKSVTSDRTTGWTALQSISAHDPILNKDIYVGTEYKTD